MTVFSRLFKLAQIYFNVFLSYLDNKKNALIMIDVRFNIGCENGDTVQ